MNHDVICLGEALVDFLPSKRGQRVREVTRWQPSIGGAPANVAVGLARLGRKSALVGVTGDDEFGHFLREGLTAEGVDTRWLRQTNEGKTGLGFVSLTAQGERSFTFYRTRAAETFLNVSDTRRARAAIDRATFAHIGTNSLLQPEARAAVLSVVKRRQGRRQLLSSDPNLRLHIWPRPQVLKELLSTLLPACDVVKLSEEEIHFVTGTDDVDRALTRLESRGIRLPIVTLGASGAAFRWRGDTVRVSAPKVRVIDTTGAGDGFMSGLLSVLSGAVTSQRELVSLGTSDLERAVRFGCTVGSRVVQKLGAVRGLPRNLRPIELSGPFALPVHRKSR